MAENQASSLQHATKAVRRIEVEKRNFWAALQLSILQTPLSFSMDVVPKGKR
ncbi:uncharacterized protein CIMG_13166 [Coccidioides immitis RS]|uniref:Uncharacterized protein n=1 Tax=Coccidioides immitis (strain RS) TaxID=246410 RepID=A0A0E1S1F7_COCIM|nr:uncharacterized protein CIMG_13166 [Coccidioides immitis RS]EAS30017.1 hypothetical protein CIMG_13166 [Coccidioides immitis RS]